jgi:hypothetical protein
LRRSKVNLLVLGALAACRASEPDCECHEGWLAKLPVGRVLSWSWSSAA